MILSVLLRLAVGGVPSLAQPANPARVPTPAGSAGFDDLIQFFDGSLLHGRLRSMSTVSGVRWEHPEARRPIDFTPTNIAWIRFEESEPILARTRPGCRIRFANGDEVLGNLLALDAQHVELETWFGDRLLARRSALQSLRFLSGNFALLYDGPTGLDGWRVGRDPSVWQYRSGTLTATGIGVLGRDLGMTNSATIEFDLAWSGQFSLNLALYTSVFDRFDYSGSAYICYLVPGYLSVQRLQGGGGSINLGQTQLPDLLEKNRAHVEIRVSKPDATIGVWIDGHLVGRWRDNGGFVAKGSGVTFFSQMDGTTLHLSNLVIAEWDGQFETEKETDAPTQDDLVFFANRDRAAGSLQAIRGGRLSFTSAQTSFDVPIERVSRVLLRRSETNALPRSPWEIRAYFAGGGAVSFQLEQWDRERVSGTSANFGQLAFHPRSIRQLRFNLDRGELLGDRAELPEDELWEVDE